MVSFTAATSCAQRERLWQEGKLLVLRQALLEGVFGIARDEDDLEIGIFLAHRLQQRRAVHFRHHHVGDDEIDRAVPFLQRLQRLDAVGGLDHAVAARAQAARVQRAQALLVLDQQDGALPGEVGARFCFRRRLLGRAIGGGGVGHSLQLGMMPRQEDVERGALIGFGIDIDEAAGLLDDAVHRRQAEPGALADFLGREERLENLVDDVGGDAGAGVGYVDPHVIRRRHALVGEMGGLFRRRHWRSAPSACRRRASRRGR